MRLRLIIRSIAQRDIIAIAQYLGRSGSDADQRFFAAIEETFALIQLIPNSGSPCTFQNDRLSGLRFCSLKRFRSYLIFYRVLSDGIEVLRVLHGSRDLDALFGPEE